MAQLERMTLQQRVDELQAKQREGLLGVTVRFLAGEQAAYPGSVQHLLRQSPAGVRGYPGPDIRFGELALEPDNAPVGREIDLRFPRIAGNERADGPCKGGDVVPSYERVEGIRPTPGQLDEGAEGAVGLEPDGGAGAGRGE